MITTNDPTIIEKACGLYESGYSQKFIAHEVGCGEKQVRKVIKNAGILRNVWNKFSQDAVCNMYNSGIKISEISKKTEIPPATIKYMLTTRNLWKFKGTTKYSFDSNFFKKIDTEEKAYWLGFIAADGNISRNVLHIGVHRNDKSHLEKFKRIIKSTHPIKDTEYKSNGKKSYMSIFEITNKQLRIDLANLGITPAKTHTLNWSLITKNIPDKYIISFMLGFFDGDGSFKCSGLNNVTFHIGCASKSFLTDYQAVMINKIGLGQTKIGSPKNKPNFGNLQYGGKNQMLKIYHFFYLNSSIFLERKREKLEKYLFKIA